ncbi:MAG TPA: hypothetical protein VFK42_10655 [Acidimicrobiales bacterium]|nr:hypothetical protein [Acidimicrobiales bacterium]
MATAGNYAPAYAALDGDVAAHTARTATLRQECFVSDDHREGVAAFVERRDPRFTGT